jgi:uncharacterized NAD(P)/FAD-binding protein YdhS
MANRSRNSLRKSNLEADLAIVGGGPAGTHVLAALGKRRRAARARIVVIERTDEMGPGLPYGEAADPKHTLGRVPWKRRDRGDALRAQFKSALEALERRGFDVVVQSSTEAQRLLRRDGAWQLETDRGSVVADNAVLATGHWHVHRLAHMERAIDWRWDVRRLHDALRKHEDVLVLGTSQSAVDIAIALAMHAQRTGEVAPAKIVLASRRGLLPSVWGPLLSSKSPPGAALQLEQLRARDDVRLHDVFEAIRLDIRKLGAKLCEDPERPVWPARPVDGAAVMRRDLQEAVDAFRDGREIPWQAVLWPTVPAVFDLFPRLVAEDRLLLAPRWYGFLRYLEAIHVDAAKQIIDLVDAGRLRICTLGEDVSLEESARGVKASGSLGEARADRVIDARGPDPRIQNSDDVFVKSVLDSGYAVPARVPFLQPPHDLEPEWETVTEAGRTYLVTGGIWVDPKTFHVRNAHGQTSNLFALGPLTLGQFPVYLGLWALRRAAGLIVKQLDY